MTKWHVDPCEICQKVPISGLVLLYHSAITDHRGKERPNTSTIKQTYVKCCEKCGKNLRMSDSLNRFKSG